MKISIKKALCSYIVTFIFLPPIYATPITLSFDSLYPMTWYEKGMKSLLCAWHELNTLQPSFAILRQAQDEWVADTQSEVLNDIILGKLAFALYCMEHMVKKGELLLQQEREYCCMILEKIDSFYKKSEKSDYVQCLENTIESILNAINHVNAITP